MNGQGTGLDTVDVLMRGSDIQQGMSSRNQLTAGQLLMRLSGVTQDKKVTIDTGKNAGGFVCYRGNYSDLAIEWARNERELTAGELHTFLGMQMNHEQEGYKGGYYLVTAATSVWTARDYSDPNGRMVTGVREEPEQVVIETAESPAEIEPAPEPAHGATIHSVRQVKQLCIEGLREIALKRSNLEELERNLHYEFLRAFTIEEGMSDG